MGKRKRNIKKSIPLDIVLTTAGSYELLEKCIESLHAQTSQDFTLCLIDGNDNIEERNKHRELLDKYHAKLLGQNVGFPRLANEGSKMGNAPLILFLSDDIILKPDAIEKMLERMKDNTIGVLGVKLLFPEDSVSAGRPAGKVQHVGLAMDVEANVVHPLVGWGADNPKTCISRDAFGVTGACILTRRALFNRVSGFDVDYGLGTYEDITLCLAIRSMGMRIFIDTDIQGYHYTGATAEKKGAGFPLQQNAQIFRAKFAQSGLFRYDSWEYY